MAYVGNQPSGNFVQVTSQTITGNGGATYTLDRPAGNSAEIEVFVNNVRQDPASYSVTGTSLTLGGNIASTDSCYVVFQSAGVGTVSHPATNNLQAADGTFTGDLTVDTNTLFVDAANNRVGVGTTSPAFGSGSGLEIERAGISTIRLDDLTDSTAIEIKAAVGAVAIDGRTNHPMLFATNGTERMRIDASGRVTMPNQPRFRARNSGITNYTSNGAISFNTEDFDVGNNYSGSTFTCPVDGLYFFSFNLFANTGHSANVDLLHNGGFIGRAERGVTTGGYETIGFSLIFECSANDAVRLQLNSGQVHTNSALNFFTGYLIG